MNATRRSSVAIGLAIASLVPVSSILVAFLWDHGAISLDPDGAFVGSIEVALTLALALIPIGLAVIGVALRLRQPLAWLALFLLGAPILLGLWLMSAVWIGGLAGEPF